MKPFVPGENLRNLILDFGGVIYQINHLKQIETFATLGVKDFGELYSQAVQSPLFADFECGKITPEKMMETISRLLDVKDAGREKIIDAWNSILVGFDDDAVKLIGKLKTRYRLFLLSNTNQVHYNVFIGEFSEKYSADFNMQFEKTYWSFKIGLRKPDEQIYRLVMRDNQLDPENTLFIDDSQQNVTGAEKSGMPAVLLSKGQRLADIFDENGNLILH